MRTVILGVAIMTLGAATLGVHAEKVHSKAAVYYQKELGDRSFSGTVSIAGRTFEFSNGSTMAEPTNVAALRIAFAALRARTDPLFGYPAEDTDALRDAADSIDASVERLVELQNNPNDAKAVRTLYPTDFMRRVASAEDARRAFVNAPSDETYKAYVHAQLIALRVGSEEAREFARSMQMYAGNERFRIIVFGGEVTNESLLQGAERVSERFDALRQSFMEEARCLRGAIAQCGDATTADTFIAPASHADETQVRDVMDLMVEAYGPGFAKNGSIVGTSKSACFANLRSPYYFHITEFTSSTPIRLKYRKDLFFVRTEGSRGDTLAYMAKDRGITYSRFEPTTYYYCPDVAYDIRTSLGALRAADFARSHASIAGRERAPLLNEFIYADDAEIYIDAALSSKNIPAMDRQELERISLLLHHGGALDIVAKEVADVLRIDLTFKDRDVPFDLSTKNLFRTHSAFSSLFLAVGDENDASAVRAIQRTESTPRGESRIERYSDMKDRFSREKIIEMIRASADFEGTL